MSSVKKPAHVTTHNPDFWWAHRRDTRLVPVQHALWRIQCSYLLAGRNLLSNWNVFHQGDSRLMWRLLFWKIIKWQKKMQILHMWKCPWAKHSPLHFFIFFVSPLSKCDLISLPHDDFDFVPSNAPCALEIFILCIWRCLRYMRHVHRSRSTNCQVSFSCMLLKCCLHH